MLLNLPVEIIFVGIFDRLLVINDILSLSQTSRPFRNLIYQYLLFALRSVSHPACMSSLVATLRRPGEPLKLRAPNQYVRFGEDELGNFTSEIVASPLDDPICAFWHQYRTGYFMIPPTLTRTELVHLGRVHAAAIYFATMSAESLRCECKQPWDGWMEDLVWSQHRITQRCHRTEPDSIEMTPTRGPSALISAL